jgi:apolipoprotein N-acyltransferase
MSIALRHRPALGTLLSVLLASAAFPPHESHQLMWVALVPWLFTIASCESAKAAAVQGFWLNWLVGLSWGLWVPSAVSEYLGVSMFAGFAALVLQACVHQIHIAFFAPALFWILRPARAAGGVGVGHILLGAFAYCGLDWLMPNIYQHSIGWALHDSRALVQVAELGGPLLLTWLILVANLGLFALLEFKVSSPVFVRARLLHAAPIAGLLAVTIGGSWLFGTLRNQQIDAALEAPLRTVRVGVVQGNVANEVRQRWSDGDIEAARETLKLYIGQSEVLLRESAATRPELIVWPESTYPGIFRRPETEAQATLNVALDQYISERGVPFIFGAYDRENRSDVRVLRNAIFAVEPKANALRGTLSPMQVYHKYILFPVGENLPFASEGFIRKWLPRAGNFSKGDGPKVLDIQLARGSGPLRIGPTICYEDLFSSHAVAMAQMGAQLIVNVSNDSWFGDYGLPRLHLIAAKLRSIETRLPQVRATNTGYSGVILQNGEVVNESEYGKTQALNVSVPITAPRETLMMQLGNWFGPTSLLLAAAGMLWLRRARRRA